MNNIVTPEQFRKLFTINTERSIPKFIEDVSTAILSNLNLAVYRDGYLNIKLVYKAPVHMFISDEAIPKIVTEFEDAGWEFVEIIRSTTERQLFTIMLACPA